MSEHVVELELEFTQIDGVAHLCAEGSPRTFCGLDRGEDGADPHALACDSCMGTLRDADQALSAGRPS